MKSSPLSLRAGLEAVPPWLGYSDAELAEAVVANSKQKPNQTKKELAALAGLLPKVDHPAVAPSHASSV